MRSKLLNITSRLLGVLIVIAVTIVNSSCSDTETTDSTKFTIYYTGMTDIGPSMTGVISSPTYKGSAPYDFAITRITLDGEPFSDSIFAIDSETGKITLNSTSNTPVGLYKLSVACYSNNNRYEYTDIVEINMMKPVPDGIKTDPEKLQVEYADIIDTENSNELPTSQIRTEGNHISISNYTIASAMWNGVAVESPEDYFAVSDKGEISIIKGNQNIQPGKYILSFKLTTAATGEDPEKGIFENALEINVTSRPLSLIYTPDEGKIEEEGERSPETTFQSNIPALKGSAEGLVYSISSVSPNTDKITIDPTTGVLSVAAHHEFKDGEKYQISVKAINEFSPEGVVFENVFTLNTVEFIEPIANFGYADVNNVQAVEIDINKNENFKGDEVKYEFVNLPTDLQGELALDLNGNIAIKKGNKIPVGQYTVQVMATNTKGSETATFTLTITANPNYFTYFRYGNNLGLTPIENYADQFRIEAGGKLNSVKPVPTATDAKDGLSSLKWEVELKHNPNNTKATINESTGQITITELKQGQCGMVMVTATAGEGKTAVSVKQPVFFHFSMISDSNVQLEYTPFVFQVNPARGGESIAPSLGAGIDKSTFRLDYRRDFFYYNIAGPDSHISGALAQKVDNFLSEMWNSYDATAGTSRKPMSYFENTTNLSKALGYIDQTDFKVHINPNLWRNKDGYANGAMIGQITYDVTGKDPQAATSGARVSPIFIWFDTKF